MKSNKRRSNFIDKEVSISTSSAQVAVDAS